MSKKNNLLISAVAVVAVGVIAVTTMSSEVTLQGELTGGVPSSSMMAGTSPLQYRCCMQDPMSTTVTQSFCTRVGGTDNYIDKCSLGTLATGPLFATVDACSSACGTGVAMSSSARAFSSSFAANPLSCAARFDEDETPTCDDENNPPVFPACQKGYQITDPGCALPCSCKDDADGEAQIRCTHRYVCSKIPTAPAASMPSR